MSYLYSNLAVITVAAVTSALAWMFGGSRGDVLLPVAPWMLLVMVEVLICFPQRHSDETTYSARTRVWKAMKADPLVWVSAAFLVLLAIPFANNGLCPGCDAARIAQGVNPRPPLSFLPFCVSRLSHLNVFLWFALALTAMVMVRHSLTSRGKRLVVELIVWNGTALALLGFVQNAAGARGPFWIPLVSHWGTDVAYFSSFGYPNMAGDYFATLFGLSVALWRNRCEEIRLADAEKESSGRSSSTDRKPYRKFWSTHYFLLPAVLFFFAALNTLSRAAIFIVGLMGIAFFFHTLATVLSRMRRTQRVKVGVWSMVVFSIVLFVSVVAMPNSLRKEVDSIDTVGVLDRVSGRGQYHSRVATALWREHPLFGCGGWGYAHLCAQKMKPSERKGLRDGIGGANVHNDHLQFLAEHGLVGVGLLVAIVCLLLAPVVTQWNDLYRSLWFKSSKDFPPRPWRLFVLPASVFFILITALCTLIHACGDCPLRSAAVLTLFFVSLASLPGFMPTAEQMIQQPKRRHHHHHHHHHKNTSE